MVLNNVSTMRIVAYAAENSTKISSEKAINDIKIVSKTSISVETAKLWAKKRNATQTFINLADLFWKYAPSNGNVNPAVAYVQAALETGYGRYGNILDETYHNTCGLKATDAGTSADDNEKEAHKRFDNWDHGVQAHLDHLALYAGAPGYPKANIEQNYLGNNIDQYTTYDPRHFKYLAGKAQTVKELSNNWAGEGYGDKLISLYNTLLAEAGVENDEAGNKPSDEKKQGWQHDDQYNWYYYDLNGELHKGWLTLPDGKYYINSNGMMHKGWYEENGRKYYFNDYGRAIVDRKEVIDGVEYEFDSKGAVKVKEGWHHDEQYNWYYYDSNGELHKDWLILPDGKYYMKPNGMMHKGWHEENDKKYYFNDYGRAIVDRKEVIDGVEYEFDSEGVLQLKQGWQHDEQYNWYYYDLNGELHKGWLTLPDGKYYMNPNGMMQKGWYEENGKKYYFNDYGRAIVDRKEVIDGVTYEFDSEGVLQLKQGWQHDEQYNWYYYDLNGIMQKGWLTLPDGKYYMNSDGIMQKGWYEEDGKKYYFNDYGRAQQGWKLMNGKEYYFYDDFHAAQFEFINDKYIGYEGYVKDSANGDKIRIVIDPGHNQRGDTGARYTHDGIVYDETQMNMDVASKVKEALEAQGYEVVMTRQKDEFQSTSSVRESLLNRVTIANNAKADLFISIHQDSYDETANGMTIFYDTYRPNVETNGVETNADGNDYDTTPCRAAVVSKEFTADLAKTLPSSLGLYNRGARYRNFYVTRNTIMPSMLIECGFISNPNEAKKLADPLHQLKMAGELTTNVNKLYKK